MDHLESAVVDDLAEPTAAGDPPESYWRSLSFFNGYRFIVATLLVGVIAIFGNRLAFGSMDLALFVYTSAGYVAFSILCFLLIGWRQHFHWQLTFQVGA